MVKVQITICCPWQRCVWGSYIPFSVSASSLPHSVFPIPVCSVPPYCTMEALENKGTTPRRVYQLRVLTTASYTTLPLTECMSDTLHHQATELEEMKRWTRGRRRVPNRDTAWFSSLFLWGQSQRCNSHTINVSFPSRMATAWPTTILSIPHRQLSVHVFRQLVPSFCVSQNITGLHANALLYIAVIHLLLLTALAYLLIELHARNYRIIVWLWRPIHKYYVKVHRNVNPRTSIIDAFATFLILLLQNHAGLLQPSLSSQPVCPHRESGEICSMHPTKTLTLKTCLIVCLPSHPPLLKLTDGTVIRTMDQWKALKCKPLVQLQSMLQQPAQKIQALLV